MAPRKHTPANHGIFRLIGSGAPAG